MDKLIWLAPRRWHPLVIVMAGIALPLMAVHALFGTPNGSSALYNLAWAEGFDAAFWAGETYPRRLDTLLEGKGGLDFFFYGPLPFWLNSTVGRALCGGCSAVAAFPLTGALLIALSGPAFYAFARAFAAARPAAIGAGIYMILPYHMLADWWLRQAVGEVAAFIFVPLIVLGMKRILDGERGVVLFALALAGLVFSHLPSLMIMGYFLAAYGAVRLWQVRAVPLDHLQPMLRLAGAGLLGLALSAVYWLPAVSLLGDVSPDALYNAYADPLNWLFLDGRAAPNPQTAFWVGSFYIAAIIAAAALLFGLRGGSSALAGWVVGPVAFGSFMVSVLSVPLWAYTPISAVQFPWRTLMVVDLGLALGGVALAARLLDRATGSGKADVLRRTGRAALVAVLSLALAAVVVMPMVAKSARGIDVRDGAPIATGALEYIPAAFLEQVRAAQREMPDPVAGEDPYLRWHGAIVTAMDRLEATAAQTTRYYHVQTVDTRRIQIDLETDRFGLIVLPWPYWSHWDVIDRASGEAMTMVVHEPSGGMAINAGPGRIEIALVLQPTLAERQGGWLSVLAAMLVLVMVLRTWLHLPLPGRAGIEARPA